MEAIKCTLKDEKLYYSKAHLPLDSPDAGKALKELRKEGLALYCVNELDCIDDQAPDVMKENCSFIEVENRNSKHAIKERIGRPKIQFFFSTNTQCS